MKIAANDASYESSCSSYFPERLPLRSKWDTRIGHSRQRVCAMDSIRYARSRMEGGVALRLQFSHNATSNVLKKNAGEGTLTPTGSEPRQILSLLRMPISPLRLRAQLLERNTFRMNRSTGVSLGDFSSPKSHFRCNWVLFGILMVSSSLHLPVAVRHC